MKLRVAWGWALLLATSFAVAAPDKPPVGALVTIVDGPGLLVREAAKLALAEGVRVGPADIVETDAAARLLRLEFDDGAIVDLGPRTRLLIAPRHAAADRARLAARLHLLQGWIKVTVPKELPEGAVALSAPPFDVEAIARSAVVAVGAGEAFVFAEAGDVRVRERGVGKSAGAALTVKSQQFLASGADAKLQMLPRPTPAFLKAVPRPFVDTLPSRAARLKARDVEPKPLGAIAYADVQDWIDADGLRPVFLARWKGLARQPEFRKGLIDNLRAHPEWDRTLFPEKYLPKPRPATAPVATAPAAPAYPR